MSADQSLLDARICERCPSGPLPGMRKVCNRCIADANAVLARQQLADEYRERLVYDGVNYADAIKYDVLVNLLPREDPACA